MIEGEKINREKMTRKEQIRRLRNLQKVRAGFALAETYKRCCPRILILALPHRSLLSPHSALLSF